MMTGISAVMLLERSLFSMDMPSSPGSMISSIISSGVLDPRAAKSASPSAKPSASRPEELSVYIIRSRMPESSSTQKIMRSLPCLCIFQLYDTA